MSKLDINELMNEAIEAGEDTGEGNPASILSGKTQEATISKINVQPDTTKNSQEKTNITVDTKVETVVKNNEPIATTSISKPINNTQVNTPTKPPISTPTVVNNTTNIHVDGAMFNYVTRSIETLDVLRGFVAKKIDIYSILKKFINLECDNEPKLIYQLMTYDNNVSDDYCKLKEYWSLSTVDRAFYLMGLSDDKLLTIQDLIYSKAKAEKPDCNINNDRIEFCKTLLNTLDSTPKEIIEHINYIAELLYTSHKTTRE